MNKGFVFALAAAFPLAACSTYEDDYYAESAPPPYEQPAPTPVATAPCPAIGGTWKGDAAIGGAVPGLAGAAWADADNDGCIDGYVREGVYYSGAPVIQTVPATYTGERG